VSPAVSMTLVVNLLPVSLTTVEHLELKISSQIFGKNQNEINEIIRGLREDDHEKKLKYKIPVTLSL
jgi:hypothetical protein